MNCLDCEKEVRLLVDGFCEECYLALLSWLEGIEGNMIFNQKDTKAQRF
jgi:hypothetical protein